MKTIHVDDEETDVSYGNPPNHTKFKPGQSGNPRGRPRRVQPAEWKDLVKVELLRNMLVTVDGKRIEIPTFQALIKATINKAIRGCTKSTKLLLDSTDGFKSIVEETKREANSADRAFLEEVRREVEAWVADDRSGRRGDGSDI